MGDPEELLVEAAALDAFAATSRDRAERFRQLATAFQEGHVSRSAFGIMPASYGLSSAYAEQFESCLAGLSDGADVMDDIADGVRRAGQAYTATDVANLDLFAPQPERTGPSLAPGVLGSSPAPPPDGHV